MNPLPAFNALKKPTKQPKKARKPILRRTKSRARDESKYRARVKEWLIGKRCAVFPWLMAVQCHHQRGRRHALLLDERFWIPVSFEGHKFIHEISPEEARSRGWLCKIGQWNTILKD